MDPDNPMFQSEQPEVYVDDQLDFTEDSGAGGDPSSAPPNKMYRPEFVKDEMTLGIQQGRGAQRFVNPAPPPPFTPGQNVRVVGPESPDFYSSQSSVVGTPASSVMTPGAGSQSPTQHSSLISMQGRLDQLIGEIERLTKTQVSLFSAVSQNSGTESVSESVSAVTSYHSSVREMIVGLLRELSGAWKTSMLLPGDIDLLREMGQDISLLQKQLDVLQAELSSLEVGPGGASVTRGPLSAGVAALVIKRQPFPLVLRKGEQLTDADSVVVKLLAAGTVATNLAATGMVTAQVLCDSHNLTRTAAAHELLDPVSVPLDPATGSAKFSFKFLDGTKNTPVTLRFSLQISLGAGITTVLETDQSAPMIVTTHKDQWRGAAGTMLKREAFLNQVEVPWPQVANTLQAHFLRATKQPASSPRRPLSKFDLMYLRKKFFDTEGIAQASFDGFWHWFGATLNVLRHQRPILQLWMQGLVYGFASKDDVDVRVGSQEVGTFIVRFSETSAGSFAIAYATAEGVKHYLVSPQDLALHKTLPDFIVSAPQFASVLKLQGSKDNPLELSLVKESKVAAYESFCSKKTSKQAAAIAKSGTYTPLA